MIIRDLYELASSGKKSIHELIDDSIDTYPLIMVDERWRDYAAGEVDDLVTPKRKRTIGVANARTPQQNMVRMCLRQIVGRFRFKGFVVDDDPDKQEWLNTYQVKNNVKRIAVSAARRALIDGNAAVSQAWRGDIDGMAYTRQEYWRNTLGYGIYVAVDDVHNPVWAVSDFKDNEDVDRRILYLPDRILHYYKGGVAEPDSEWSLDHEDRWVDQAGNPIGVPVSHFPNSDPDYGPYGTSTVGEIVAVQDALNLSLFNRMAVSALTGQQIYYGTGVRKTADQQEVGPGVFLTSEDPASKFGAIPPGSLEGIMLETDDLRGVISGAFPVPSYRLGAGDWPSGLALQRSDGPMVTGVRLLRDVMIPGLVHHAHRATVMANAFGGKNFDLETLITTDWEPIDELDPATEAEIQQARVDALATAETLSEVGLRKSGLFDDDEIKKILEDRKAAEEEAMLLAQAETDI